MGRRQTAAGPALGGVGFDRFVAGGWCASRGGGGRGGRRGGPVFGVFGPGVRAGGLRGHHAVVRRGRRQLPGSLSDHQGPHRRFVRPGRAGAALADGFVHGEGGRPGRDHFAVALQSGVHRRRGGLRRGPPRHRPDGRAEDNGGRRRRPLRSGYAGRPSGDGADIRGFLGGGRGGRRRRGHIRGAAGRRCVRRPGPGDPQRVPGYQEDVRGGGRRRHLPQPFLTVWFGYPRPDGGVHHQSVGPHPGQAGGVDVPGRGDGRYFGRAGRDGGVDPRPPFCSGHRCAGRSLLRGRCRGCLRARRNL